MNDLLGYGAKFEVQREPGELTPAEEASILAAMFLSYAAHIMQRIGVRRAMFVNAAVGAWDTEARAREAMQAVRARPRMAKQAKPTKRKRQKK